jgi:hypothetical protein
VIPVINIGDGVVDGVQQRTASLEVKSNCRFVSCSGVESSLEYSSASGASGDDGELVLLRVWTEKKCQRVRQSKGERTRPERRCRVPMAHRNRRTTVTIFADSGGRIGQPGGVI